MPNISGTQFLTTLKNNRSIDNYYIIGVTGDDVETKFRNLGCKNFISKPFDRSTINNALQNAIQYIYKTGVFNMNKTTNLMDPNKLFFNFDSTPTFQDDINSCKEELKKFGVDYFAVDGLDQNNEYCFLKYDHREWHEYSFEQLLLFEKKEFYRASLLNITSSKNNHFIALSDWKKHLFDIRAHIIGDKKNGLTCCFYDDNSNIKLDYTITFKDNNTDVLKMNQNMIQELLLKLKSFNHIFIPYFSKFINNSKKQFGN